MLRGHPGKIVKMIFRTGIRYFLIGLSIKFIFQPVKKDITGQISRTLDQKLLYSAETQKYYNNYGQNAYKWCLTGTRKLRIEMYYFLIGSLQ